MASIIMDNDVNQPRELITLKTLLQNMSGTEFEEIPEQDSKDKATWCFAFCGADFKPRPMLSLNHFVPVWHEQQVLPEVFEAAQVRARDCIAARLSGLEKKIARAQEQSDRMPALEKQQVMDSLESDRVLLKAEEEFLELLSSKNMVPKLVPADGNCGAWTLLTLEQGLTEARDFTKEDVMQLRMETWRETSGIIGQAGRSWAPTH